MIAIRPYQETDEPHVASLWREQFPDAPAWNDPREDIRRKLAIQRDLFLVAISGERLVGSAMAGFDGHRGWVYYVAVASTHQRQGLGRALMERVETGLRAIGCPKLNLQVRGSNKVAVEFYRRLGYETEDRVSMGKRLMGGDDS